MQPLPDKMTIGEWADPAMKITKQSEADAYFKLLVERHMRLSHQSREVAEKIVRENLGYYAGYCSDETRERVERLFKCAHPFFGPISKGKPTPEEAFEMGKKYASS